MGRAHHYNAGDSRHWCPAAIIRAPQTPGCARIPDCHRGLRRTPATTKGLADNNRIGPAWLVPADVRGVTGALARRSWRSLACLVADTRACLELPRYPYGEQQAVARCCCNP